MSDPNEPISLPLRRQLKALTENGFGHYVSICRTQPSVDLPDYFDLASVDGTLEHHYTYNTHATIITSNGAELDAEIILCSPATPNDADIFPSWALAPLIQLIPEGDSLPWETFAQRLNDIAALLEEYPQPTPQHVQDEIGTLFLIADKMARTKLLERGQIKSREDAIPNPMAHLDWNDVMQQLREDITRAAERNNHTRAANDNEPDILDI